MKRNFMFLLFLSLVVGPLACMEKPYDVTQNEDMEYDGLEVETLKPLDEVQRENKDWLAYHHKRCHYCNASFTSQKKFKAHIKESYPTKFLFNCHKCSKQLIRPEAFDKHLARHAALYYVCFYQTCRQTFFGKNAWIDHLESEH